jgi:hypothetical protein
MHLGPCLAEAQPETPAAVDGTPAKPAEKTKSPGTIEVETADGRTLALRDQAGLRRSISTMQVLKNDRARVIMAEGKEPAWATVQQVAAADFKTQCLYEPISAHIQKGALIGALIGVVLKALDTTVLMFAVDPGLGLTWLVVVAALLTPKFKTQMMIAAIILSIKLGAGNLFLSALGVGLVGISFGLPGGMVIGALTGLFRRPAMTKAWDAVPEEGPRYLWKMILPTAWLAFWAPFYLFWLNPKIVEWLAK